MPDKPLVTLTAADFEQIYQTTLARPRPVTPAFIEAEKARCKADPVYFIVQYCKIFDNASQNWIAFKLWPAQEETVRLWWANKFLVVMKARQEGFTWLLGDCLTLWQMLFAPIAEVLVFSQREDEAKKLLDRIIGTYERLPDWMKLEVTTKNTTEFRINNGSGVQALPGTAGGRSNAATYVVVDEADFVDNLGRLISYAKPTIDAGKNKMVVLSTVNEDVQGSFFQNLYVSARDGETQWRAVFFGWMAHPGRTQEWYEREKDEVLRQYGSYDPLYKRYPATDTEALSARSLNTRFPPAWLSAVSRVRQPLSAVASAPLIPGLKVYLEPKEGHHYGLGADPAGGLTDSDDSDLCVVDADTLEQVAVLQNKNEPTEFANQAHLLSRYYANAPVLFELNNHGHAFLAQARENGTVLKMGMNRRGRTEREPGWLTTERSKGNLYDTGADAMREILNETADAGGVQHPELARKILVDAKTIAQLGTIDVKTLSAPENAHDDAAMAWVLALKCVYAGVSDMTQAQHDLWQTQSPPARTERMSAAAPIPSRGRGAWAPPPGESEAVINEKLRARGLL